MKTPSCLTLCAIAMCLSPISCDQAPQPQTGDAAPAARASEQPSAPTAATKPAPKRRGVGGGARVHPVTDGADLKRLVKGYRGRVVLLDFWATWCVPCVENLPKLRKLQDKYGDRDLRIITISFDKASEWDTKTEKVLRGKGNWNGPGVVARDKEAEDEIVEWLATKWRSELPAQFLFNRDGELVREILEVNESELPPLEQMIEELIKQKAKPFEPESSKGPPRRR